MRYEAKGVNFAKDLSDFLRHHCPELNVRNAQMVTDGDSKSIVFEVYNSEFGMEMQKEVDITDKSKLEVMKTIVEDIENADYLEQNKVKFSHYGDGYDFSML
jgi:hypothetical protein